MVQSTACPYGYNVGHISSERRYDVFALRKPGCKTQKHFICELAFFQSSDAEHECIMTNDKETFTGFTFRPHDATSLNFSRYSTVSHTALHFPNLRKSQENGHCTVLESSGTSHCLHRCTSIRSLKLIVWSSWVCYVMFILLKLLTCFVLCGFVRVAWSDAIKECNNKQ